MSEDLIGYDRIVEDALRGVVREALKRAAAAGLPGEHHFYVTCRTGAPGVVVPPALRKRYPEEVTIVLQHQFWDLAVDRESFSVTLSFGGRKEHVEIPFDAITGFADPGVRFALRFEPAPAADAGEDRMEAPVSAEDDTAAADVVVLDRFRRK